jgi:hypothetical protein
MVEQDQFCRWVFTTAIQQSFNNESLSTSAASKAMVIVNIVVMRIRRMQLEAEIKVI